MSGLDAVALVTSILAGTAAAIVVVGTRRLTTLANVAPAGVDRPPVSIVVAARNEAAHIEAALRTMLATAYDDLEVVVVDDRSSDDTPVILERLRAANPRLRTSRVDELPPGWLGKNHALQRGAAVSGGEFIVFTDADVNFAPDALARAVRVVMERRLDHLTATPAITSPSWAVRTFVASFSLFFSLFTRPWRVRDARSRAFIGIGAFNLVRAGAYRAAGGHEPIRMRPDDDLQLGRMMKLHGGRSDCVVGAGLLSLAWYATLGDLVSGMMKNGFAGVGYRVSGTIASVIALLASGVLPFVMSFVVTGWPRVAAAAAAVALLMAAMLASRSTGLARWYALGLPASALMFSWILVRAAVLTVTRGGIEWRGTFYPLPDLKKSPRGTGTL